MTDKMLPRLTAQAFAFVAGQVTETLATVRQRREEAEKRRLMTHLDWRGRSGPGKSGVSTDA